MSATWSGTAPTGFYFRWEAGSWDADTATSSILRHAISTAEIVLVTSTGPRLTVTNDDELSLYVKTAQFWQEILTDDQLARMRWTNAPTFDEGADNVRGLVY